MGLGPRAQKKAMKRLALFLMGATSLSCRSVEHEVLDRFFEAEIRRDKESVALLSMVAFPGEVLDYRVVSIAEERRGPYRVARMRERVDESEKQRDEQFKLFGDFRQANYEELLKIQRLLLADPERKLEGRQGDLQRQWDAFREEMRATHSSFREAQMELEWEIRCVQKSLQREADPESLTGETLTREASVRVTAKGSKEGVYVVTLTRYDVQNSFGAVVPTRWIVTSIAPEAE